MKKLWMILVAITALGLGQLRTTNAITSDDEAQLIQLERAWNQAEQGPTPRPLFPCFRKRLFTLTTMDHL